MTPIQPRRPIVAVAYGKSGAVWLDRLQTEISSLAMGIRGDGFELPLQFWAIGLDPEEFSGELGGFKCMSGDPGPGRLRHTLDEIRTFALMQQFPGLRVDSILVLERWSPLENDVDERASLQENCDIGSRVQFRSGAAREFDFTWIGLADAVRPAGAFQDGDGGRIRGHFSLPNLSNFHFLVDRQNEDSAVLDPVEADEMLHVLARSIILTELAGSSVVDGLANTDTDDSDNPGTVIGFSVCRFRHAPAHLATAAEAHFRNRLIADPIDSESLQASRALLEELRQDLALGDSPYSEGRNRERFERVSRALAGGLARKRAGIPNPWNEFEVARRELQAHPARPVGLGVPVGGVNEPDFHHLPVFRRFWYWIKSLFRRDHHGPGGPEILTPVTNAATADSPAEAWKELLSRAGKVSRSWERWLMETPAVEKRASPWIMDNGDRVLAALPSVAQRPEPIPQHYWLELARRLLEKAEVADEVGLSSVDRVISSVAVAVEFGLSGASKVSVIEGALREAVPTFEATSNRLSVFVGQSLNPSKVIWFHGLSEERDNLFAEFERRSQSSPPQVIALDRRDDTVRVSLTAPMSWTRIISLNVGRAE